MSRPLAVLVGVVAGCLVGMQAPINSRLGKVIGSLPAASFSFLVGTAVLLVITSIVGGGLGALGNVGRAPSWASSVACWERSTCRWRWWWCARWERPG